MIWSNLKLCFTYRSDCLLAFPGSKWWHRPPWSQRSGRSKSTYSRYYTMPYNFHLNNQGLVQTSNFTWIDLSFKDCAIVKTLTIYFPISFPKLKFECRELLWFWEERQNDFGFWTHFVENTRLRRKQHLKKNKNTEEILAVCKSLPKRPDVSRSLLCCVRLCFWAPISASQKILLSIL
jgi:hypothetical protein